MKATRNTVTLRCVLTSAKELCFSVWALYGLSWAWGIWGGFGVLFATVAARVLSACWKFCNILCSWREEGELIQNFYNSYLPFLRNAGASIFLITSWPWGDWNSCATAAKASELGSSGTEGTAEALVTGSCGSGWESVGTVEIKNIINIYILL